MNTLSFKYRGISGLILVIMIITSSCTKYEPEALEFTFLPGECLVSPALSFSTDYFRIYDNSTDVEHTGRFDYRLVFDLDMESVEHKVPESRRDYQYRPAEAVFAEFGENSFAVKDAYETCWHNVASSVNWGDFSISTIFYDSGASLVADKDFARFKAGDNILVDALSRHEWIGSEDRDHRVYIAPLWANTYPDIQLSSFQYSYALGSHTISISIPWKGGEMLVVDEDVTFTFKMPVKVGLYLTWLNDKITDPDAPFPFREETLTCTFTTHKGVHPW